MKQVEAKAYKDMQDAFQLVLGLTLFYPVILLALYGMTTDTISANSNILSWGAVIVTILVDYLFLKWLGDKILPWVTRYTYLFLLLDIAFFIDVIGLLSYYKNQTIPWSQVYVLDFLSIGILGTMFTPFLILIILGINTVYSSFKSG